MAEARPRGRHHQHVVADAELARDDVDHRHVAAVRVDDDQLLDAGAVDAVADVEPEFCRRLPGAGQRSRRRDVLVRFADRLHRQERHRQVVGQELDRPPDHALGDAGVGVDRQMRPMLLDRRDRQHGDPARRVAPRRSRGWSSRPSSGGGHWHCHASPSRRGSAMMVANSRTVAGVYGRRVDFR